jgi:hypothetical protein
MATAILLSISTLAGLCLGPPTVGWISDLVTRHMFSGDYSALCLATRRGGSDCLRASTTGLQTGLLAASWLFAMSGVAFLFCGSAYAREASGNAQTST